MSVYEPRRPRDRPEEDVNVQAVHGFDVTSLSVEELAAAGVILTPYPITATIGEHRAYMTHSSFLAEHRPEWDLIHRGVARAALAEHAAQLAARVEALRTREVAAAIAGQDKRAAAAAKAAADDLEAHPLRGLRLHRSFPCLGTLRVIGDATRWRAVQCDVCGDRFAVVNPKPEEPDTDAGGSQWAQF